MPFKGEKFRSGQHALELLPPTAAALAAALFLPHAAISEDDIFPAYLDNYGWIENGALCDEETVR